MMPKARRGDDFILRVLVLSADREMVARLRETLFAVGDVELLGSSVSVPELLAQCAQQQPDLILLDTDRLGSETDAVAAAVRARGEEIRLVALTAAPQHAPAGVPVLLRPPSVDAARALFAALRTDARRELAPRLGRPEGIGDREAAGPWLRRLLVRSPGHVRLLPVEDILWIDAIHNAVKLHSLQGEFRLRQSIAALVAQLDPERFVRIHRSTVVQLDTVREFRVNARGQYSAVMPGGAKLTVSRSFHDALLARLRQA
jgi:two-component system LytT family response regulator